MGVGQQRQLQLGVVAFVVAAFSLAAGTTSAADTSLCQAARPDCQIGPEQACSWSGSELQLCGPSIVVNGSLEITTDVRMAAPLQALAVQPGGQVAFAGNASFGEVGSFAVQQGASLTVAGTLAFEGEVHSFAIHQGATMSVGAELQFNGGVSFDSMDSLIEIGSESGGSMAAEDDEECPQQFTVPLFRYFFDETGLSELPADPDLGCAITQVEDYMKALFGEYQLFSLILAPLVYFLLYVLAVTAKCPVRKGCIGRVFFLVWLTLQCLSMLFFVASIFLYISSYIRFSQKFQDYFVKLGSVAMLHLVIAPMCMLLMPAVNKLAPLMLLLSTTADATSGWDVLSDLVDDVQSPNSCIFEAPCRTFLIVFTILPCILVFGIPIVVGGLYFFGTLSVLFCVPFLPLPCLQAITLLGATLCITLLPPSVFLGEHLGVDPTAHAKKLLGELGLSGQSKLHNDQGTSKRRLICPLGVILSSPLAVIGVMYAFLCYHGDEVSIKDIYAYVIDPELFVLPSVVDIEAFLEEPFSWFASIEDIIDGFEIAPLRILSTSRAMSVAATLIASLKNIIAVGNVIWKTMGGWGFETVAVQLVDEESSRQKAWAAYRSGDVEVLRSYQEGGLRIGAYVWDDGTTAAMYACKCGHLEVVKYLHTDVKEADFAAKDDKGMTAAMWACFHGRLEVVRYLHTHVKEADFAAKDSICMTAAMYACERGRLEVVKYLHTDVKEADFAAKDDKGWTAAMLACMDGRLEVVKYLHTNVKEADFAAKDDKGMTAAMLATEVVRQYLGKNGL